MKLRLYFGITLLVMWLLILTILITTVGEFMLPRTKAECLWATLAYMCLSSGFTLIMISIDDEK